MHCTSAGSEKVNRKEQLCLVIHHEEFKTGDDYDELHAVVKHWKVHSEGDPDLFFTERQEPEGQQQEHEQTPLPAAIDDLLSKQATTEQTIEALCGVVEIDEPCTRECANYRNNFFICFWQLGA